MLDSPLKVARLAEAKTSKKFPGRAPPLPSHSGGFEPTFTSQPAPRIPPGIPKIPSGEFIVVSDSIFEHFLSTFSGFFVIENLTFFGIAHGTCHNRPRSAPRSILCCF